MPIVVSDTSPIRALAHLSLIDLLRDLFGEVLIPPAVEVELGNPASGLITLDVRGYPFIHIQAPGDRDRVDQFLRGLDRGESEALALALETGASPLLMDEAAGRALARSLGLIPVGVLGILARAKHRGAIGAVAPLIDRLQGELRFFISPKLRSEVLRSVGE